MNLIKTGFLLVALTGLLLLAGAVFWRRAWDNPGAGIRPVYEFRRLLVQ